MHRLKRLSRRLFTPVTIMLIPHNSGKPLNVKLPSIGLLSAGVFAAIGAAYVLSVAVNAFEYQRMRQTVNYYTGQFTELRGTIDALRRSEAEFRRLFSLKKKEDVLESYHASDTGAIDMEALNKQISESIESVKEIKDYLHNQKSIYEATPTGWPVAGSISSGFGGRVHPISGRSDFHSGVDIQTDSGTEVRATADGVVSFSGFSGGNGNLVVIEHGQGYSTIYAHNESTLVRTGQVVKRAEAIARSGSTGLSTGPHLHYEVWKNGRPLNPSKFLEGRAF
jgi:murein DD-endopeptidase MepM/ murein hydrolase activator NlpD